MDSTLFVGKMENRVHSSTPIMHEVKECRSSDVTIGDLVLLEGCCPRAPWKTARVTELFPGQNDAVQAYKLMLPERELLTRPMQKVYLLFTIFGLSCIYIYSSSTGDDVMNRRD